MHQGTKCRRASCLHGEADVFGTRKNMRMKRFSKKIRGIRMFAGLWECGARNNPQVHLYGVEYGEAAA